MKDQALGSDRERQERGGAQDGKLPGHSTFRLTMHSGSLADVENSSVAGDGPMPSGLETDYQVVMPYQGLFSYRVGQREWILDANMTLLISPGWEFRDEQPVPGLGHASLIINPTREVVDEICGRASSGRHSRFAATAFRSSHQLRLLGHWMLREGADMAEPLQKDEWVVLALHHAMQGRVSSRRASSRIVDRAKELLHALGSERLSLAEIAGQVGVSPVYLSQEFTRAEGVPLYQYQLELRLGRSLVELPRTENITGLALDLGFYSHSHFSASFRRAFGMTPSAFRASTDWFDLSGLRLSPLEIYRRAARRAA